jgi:hypothetical protein
MRIRYFIAVAFLALGLSQAKAENLILNITPTSGSFYTDTGHPAWNTTISGSTLGVINTAANATPVLYFPIPAPFGSVVSKIKVRFNIIVAPIDAAPSFVVKRVYWGKGGTASTPTTETVTETESGCTAVTVNTHYTCTISLTTPVKIAQGDQLSLQMTINQAATSQTFIYGLETWATGN